MGKGCIGRDCYWATFHGGWRASFCEPRPWSTLLFTTTYGVRPIMIDCSISIRLPSRILGASQSPRLRDICRQSGRSPVPNEIPTNGHGKPSKHNRERLILSANLGVQSFTVVRVVAARLFRLGHHCPSAA